MHNPSDILARPEAYGLRWETDTVRQDGRGDKGRPFVVPILAVNDLDTFEEKFPGLLLDFANTQSLRVGSQRISRNNADKLSAEAIKLLTIQWLLGIRVKVRTPIEVPVFMGPNGERFTDETQQRAAWLAFAAEQNAK